MHTLNSQESLQKVQESREITRIERIGMSTRSVRVNSERKPTY